MALEDYSINLRTDTFQLKHRNNLYEMEMIKSDPELDFFTDCIAEMKEIMKLEEQLNIAQEGIAQVYNIDEFSARDQVQFEMGMGRPVAMSVVLPKRKLDIESLAAQADAEEQNTEAQLPQVQNALEFAPALITDEVT